MCMNCLEDKMVSTASLSPEKEQFANKLLSMMNAGAAALMISIGHRTGLFDTMAKLPASTSLEIAQAANLKYRYVREWLGAMVTFGIVHYEPGRDAYSLPEIHAAFLTREGEEDNIASVTQFFSVLGTVENQIVDCFRNGGGVPYSDYPRFQEVMAEESGNTVLPALIEHIIPIVPGMTEKLVEGCNILDVGCGRGRALTLLAEQFPNSRFTGYDISEEAVTYANQEAKKKKLENIQFVVQDAASFSEENAYDLITTFDAIHDQAHPAKVLYNIRRALRPDGYYLMQDIDMHSNVGENLEHPMGTFIYTISCMHCMTVSLADGGAGLGAAWGVELAQEMLNETGFRSYEIKRLPHDIMNCYYIVQK